MTAPGNPELRVSNSNSDHEERNIISAISTQDVQKNDMVRDENNESKIISFLLYLREQKEFGIYYYLLREVEVVEFTDNSITISSRAREDLKRNELKSLLLSWASHEYTVNTAISHGTIMTIQDKIKQDVIDSKEWKMISSLFKDASISDILLK